MINDVSPDFKANRKDTAIVKNIVKLEGTPDAIKYFSDVCDQLTDYSYWFLLSTLWVSYSDGCDIGLWKKLFRESRPKRQTSLMKPSELEEFNRLPFWIQIFRAHRPGENDWIAATLDPVIAGRFAVERGVAKVSEYRVRKTDIIALFMRRGEKEIIVRDKDCAEFLKEWEVKKSHE